MRRAGESGELAGKRVQRGVTHGQGKGMGSELPGADTALDGTLPQHGKGLLALFWSLREGQTQPTSKPSGNHLLPALLHPTCPQVGSRQALII